MKEVLSKSIDAILAIGVDFLTSPQFTHVSSMEPSFSKVAAFTTSLYSGFVNDSIALERWVFASRILALYNVSCFKAS